MLVRVEGEIHPRDMEFGLSPDLPRHWHGGDPYVTQFFNGLSLMFPDGERFFMDAVRHYQDRVTDPALRQQVRGFLGQEGIHAREHRAYNRMLATQGYPAAAIERFVARFVDLDRKTPRLWQLAMTCALEHFTAVFADVMLRDPRVLADAHPTMARLWRWHALEEAEHKAVAFDVYRTVAPGLGGYLLRILVMFLVTLGFSLQVMLHESWLLRSEGLFWKIRARRAAFRFLWVTPGVLPAGLRHYLAYYRRDFHPWQIDSADLIERARLEYAA
jgi:predicted metal-dependent hydrolase